MSTLVIGSGLVGSQIVREELEREANQRIVILDVDPKPDALDDIFPTSKVEILRGDVTDTNNLGEIFRDKGIDTVYHTAAYPGFTITSMQNPSQAIAVNVMGFVNVLEAARRWNVSRVLYTSSNTISTYIEPAKDDCSSLNKEYSYHRPTTIYAATKLACENFGLIYSSSYGIDFRAVRLAAVFGPWRYGGGGGPTNLVREMLVNSLAALPMEVSFGDFEYVYSKDAGRGSVLACRADHLRDRIFNIGLGRFYKLEELVRLIWELIPTSRIRVVRATKDMAAPQFEGNTEVRKRMPDPVIAEPLDLTRSREQLGYEPKYQMKEALEDYVSFLKTRISP